MMKINEYECIEKLVEDLANLQKDITSNKPYITYNYELASLAIIAAFKRIKHRDTFFPVELSDFRNAKQVDGMVLCPENTRLTTIVQVKCIHNNEHSFLSLSRKLNGYLFRHYRYLAVCNNNIEDDENDKGNKEDINYVIVNYDYHLNISSLNESEISQCTYDFFSDFSSHDNHIIRIEKMLQHIEHYKDEDSYKPTYEWLQFVLNYIHQCSYNEHRCASDCVLNDGMYKISSIRFSD